MSDELDSLRALQARLFDDGWARYGWPEEIGGLGGDIRHRMLFIDLLEQNGFPPRHALVAEHVPVQAVNHAVNQGRSRSAPPERVSDYTHKRSEL